MNYIPPSEYFLHKIYIWKNTHLEYHQFWYQTKTGGEQHARLKKGIFSRQSFIYHLCVASILWNMTVSCLPRTKHGVRDAHKSTENIVGKKSYRVPEFSSYMSLNMVFWHTYISSPVHFLDTHIPAHLLGKYLNCFFETIFVAFVAPSVPIQYKYA